MLGFKKMLLVSMSLIIVISVGTSSYLSYMSESQALNEAIYKSTQEIVRAESNKVEDFLASKAKAVDMVADDYRQYKYQDGHAERMRIGAISADVVNLMIGFENGDAYASFDYPGWIDHKSPSSYDPRTKPWYKNGMRSSGLIYTPPYNDATTGTLMVSVGKGAGNGVVLADIPLDVLSDIVSEIDIPGVVALMMTDDTTVLASSSPVVKVGDKLKEHSELIGVVNGVQRSSEAIIDYQLNGVDKVMFSKTIRYGDKEWHLMLGLDKSVVFAVLDAELRKVVLLTFAYLAVSVLLALVALNMLYRPILALKKTILSLSSGNGDLTQRLEVKTDDDLGQIANGVNQFIENIQQLMLKIDSAASELKVNAKTLEQTSQENHQMLSQHVQETEQIVTAIEEMNSTADAVAQSAGETAQSTNSASEIGGESLQAVGEAQGKVNELVAEVENTSQNLQRMSEETGGISNILSVIGEIAEQTNLLALNAAIEAARAGEQGRGFAVVADEVRALASRTQESTEEIEQSLARLLSVNDNVVQSMEKTKNTCHETFSNTEKVGESLNSLTSNVSDINDLSVQIATAAEEQSCVTQEVSRNMSALSDIVNQLNGNGEQVVSQTNSIARVNEQLVSIVNQFKLR